MDTSSVILATSLDMETTQI